MINDYIRQRENLANLFLLVDSRHEPQKKDIDFINKLGEWQIPFSIVFTKSDKNKPGGDGQEREWFYESIITNMDWAACSFC